MSDRTWDRVTAYAIVTLFVGILAALITLCCTIH